MHGGLYIQIGTMSQQVACPEHLVISSWCYVIMMLCYWGVDAVCT